MKKNKITVVNGTFSPEDSELHEKMVVCSKGQAMLSYQGFLKNYYILSEKEEKNRAILDLRQEDQEGLFIYLPPNTELELPIEIVHVIQEKTTSHVHLFAGKCSNVQISQKFVFEKEAVFYQIFDFSLDSGAKVTFLQENHTQSSLYTNVRANVKADATFNHLNGNNQGKESASDIKVSLAGPNSETDLRGWWKLTGDHKCSTTIFVEHQAPNTRSRQFYKGVLFDKGRSKFEGKIYVHPEAQQTDAFQLNNNLILSDDAYADTKPGLEIFADDVKASHGATIGKIDAEQLFYFKTRGFSEEAAKNFLIEGFLQEVMTDVS